MLDSLIADGFWLGVVLGFVGGIMFAFYALPPIVHLMAGHVRDRE